MPSNLYLHNMYLATLVPFDCILMHTWELHLHFSNICAHLELHYNHALPILFILGLLLITALGWAEMLEQ